MGLVLTLVYVLQKVANFFSEETCKRGMFVEKEALYSKTCIKRTPSIKWMPALVLKFSSHIYCEIKLLSADISVLSGREHEH